MRPFRPSALFLVVPVLALPGCGGAPSSGGSGPPAPDTVDVTVSLAFSEPSAVASGVGEDGATPILMTAAGHMHATTFERDVAVPPGTAPELIAGRFVSFKDTSRVTTRFANYTSGTSRDAAGDYLLPSRGTADAPAGRAIGFRDWESRRLLDDLTFGPRGTDVEGWIEASNGAWDVLTASGGWRVERRGQPSVALQLPAGAILMLVTDASVNDQGYVSGIVKYSRPSHDLYYTGWWDPAGGAFHPVTQASPSGVKYDPVRRDSAGGFLYNVVTFGTGGSSTPTSVVPKWLTADGKLRVFHGLPIGAVIKEVTDDGKYLFVSTGYYEPATSVYAVE